MDPLSAIPTAIRAELRPSLLPGGIADGKNLSIPTSELSALRGAGGPSAISAPSTSTIAPTSNVESGSGSFERTLGNAISEVSQRQADASTAVSGLLTGQNVPLHQAMIAMEEASVSFQLMVEVRNKLLESYQELMRMQI